MSAVFCTNTFLVLMSPGVFWGRFCLLGEAWSCSLRASDSHHFFLLLPEPSWTCGLVEASPTLFLQLNMGVRLANELCPPCVWPFYVHKRTTPEWRPSLVFPKLDPCGQRQCAVPVHEIIRNLCWMQMSMPKERKPNSLLVER